MTETPTISKKVFNHFKDQPHFTRQELHDFLLTENPSLSEGTFGWRINSLKKKNVIQQIKSGIYTVHVKREFPLSHTNFMRDLRIGIAINAGKIRLCMWSITLLQELSENHGKPDITILEVEPPAIDRIFWYLDRSQKYSPFIDRIDINTDKSKHLVVIRRLIPRSPINTVTQDGLTISIPSIEKILVDIFIDTNAKDDIQRTQLIGMFDKALSKYIIDFSKLRNYASRRGKGDHIKHFIREHLPHHASFLL